MRHETVSSLYSGRHDEEGPGECDVNTRRACVILPIAGEQDGALEWTQPRDFGGLRGLNSSSVQ